MGRDWYKLGGGRRGGGGSFSSSNSKRKSQGAVERNVSGSDDSHCRNIGASGCVAALFQFLDFHHVHHQSSSSKSTIENVIPKDTKGLAAPRNSLESTESSSSSATHNQQERLSIPMGTQMETKAGAIRSKLGALTMDTSRSSSGTVSSPCTKTPTLVARLMGLDLLPDDDTTVHNHSCPNLHKMSHRRPRHIITSNRLSFNGKSTGTMSLPDSPRVSSARRSDFDLHRHSLQLNRENKCEEFRCSRLGQEDESRNLQDYARQIVNQTKERVSIRRIGMDITNMVKNREPDSAKNLHELQRNIALSCSPRNRFPQKENRVSTNPRRTSPSISKQDQISQKPQPPPSPPTMSTIVSEPRAPRARHKPKREKQQLQQQLRPINKCKKADSETRFSPMPRQRFNTQNKQKEIFVRTSTTLDKKFKKTSLPDYDISVSSVVPVEKIPSPPAAKLPQKQVNEAQAPKWNLRQSICPSQTYKHDSQVTRYPNVVEATAAAATSTNTNEISEFSSEFKYITRILRYAGVRDANSLISSLALFSPPLPLDLSIFRNLENLGGNPSGKLALRCNRKLLFDLVNEILVNLLKPQTKLRRDYHGSQLVGELCSAIRSYQRASFRVTEDIDANVTGNLPETTKFEAEGEQIVAEIERDTIDALVLETASYFVIEAASRWRLRGVKQAVP